MEKHYCPMCGEHHGEDSVITPEDLGLETSDVQDSTEVVEITAERDVEIARIDAETEIETARIEAEEHIETARIEAEAATEIIEEVTEAATEIAEAEAEAEHQDPASEELIVSSSEPARAGAPEPEGVGAPLSVSSPTLVRPPNPETYTSHEVPSPVVHQSSLASRRIHGR